MDLQNTLQNYKPLISFLLGIALVVGISQFYNPFVQESGWDDVEQIEEVHVHSDFALYILGNRIDLSDDKYQSRIGHILLEDFHLHDNNDKVIHRHANGLTLWNFVESLGFTLTDSCITLDTGEAYCEEGENELVLYVNGESVDSPSEYISQEGDRILLYFGDPDASGFEGYVESISSDACIYSGTCPERGTPPPESCGLTCEV